MRGWPLQLLNLSLQLNTTYTSKLRAETAHSMLIGSVIRYYPVLFGPPAKAL